MSAPLDSYLAELRRELRKCGVAEGRIVEEVREHLVDAIHTGLERGISVEAAESEAFARFGTPREAAAQFAQEKCSMMNRLFMMLSRIARLMRREAVDSASFHDVTVPSRYHFALRLKGAHRKRFMKMSPEKLREFIAEGRERGEDMSAFETEPRERLAHFLREFGHRHFGSDGTLESLTLLADTAGSGRREGRYLAAFGTGTKMIWTVALSADGAVSFDGFNAPA